jgi:hypothetical protein
MQAVGDREGLEQKKTTAKRVGHFHYTPPTREECTGRAKRSEGLPEDLSPIYIDTDMKSTAWVVSCP